MAFPSSIKLLIKSDNFATSWYCALDEILVARVCAVVLQEPAYLVLDAKR